MSARTVTIDAATRDRLLADGNGSVDVQDETGAVIGTFYRSGPPSPPAGYAIEGEWLSDEEFDRRIREDRPYTLAEANAFVEGLKRALR